MSAGVSFGGLLGVGRLEKESEEVCLSTSSYVFFLCPLNFELVCARNRLRTMYEGNRIL